MGHEGIATALPISSEVAWEAADPQVATARKNYATSLIDVCWCGKGRR